MGEAILTRAGGGSGGSAIDCNLITKIITSNTTWTVPKALAQEFSVRIFGGGGGPCKNGSWFGGGGGGYMNYEHSLILNEGDSISITIGQGGALGNNANGGTGGTTSFGTYLSAPGGGGAIYLDEFYIYCKGGSGGSGGGSAGNYKTDGGTGYQFGGGGAAGYTCHGGGGGFFGGGGGGGAKNGSRGGGSSGPYGGSGSGYGVEFYYSSAGIFSGTYSSNEHYNGGSGTNTMLIEPSDLSGDGAGGGKFGGGGGYGGRGGNGAYNTAITITNNISVAAGGGGGGYGANGGHAATNTSNYYRTAGGGGGGYSKAGYGGNAYSASYIVGGGGGAYCHGASYSAAATYGGGGAYTRAGAAGVCIIQYYG